MHILHGTLLTTLNESYDVVSKCFFLVGA